MSMNASLLARCTGLTKVRFGQLAADHDTALPDCLDGSQGSLMADERG